jgi:hypothetical protein
MLATVLLAAGLNATSLEVEVAPGLDCPTAAAVERSLERRVAGAAPGWRVVLDEAGEAPGGAVRLRLQQPGGAAVLERVLKMESPRCETGAEAVAVVVERYFRQLIWSPPPSALPEREGAAAVVATAPAASGTAPGDRGPAPRVVVLIGPMLSTVGPDPVGGAAELRVRLAGPFHAGLGLLFPRVTAVEALPAGGSASLRAWPFMLRALAERTRGSWAVLAGLDAVLSVEHGSSTQIARPSEASRLMLAAGGSLGLAWLPTRRLRIAAEAGVARLLLGNDFDVEGHGRVLGPPTWQGRMALRLGWTVWP